jgi:CHAD domain-containing protein
MSTTEERIRELVENFSVRLSKVLRDPNPDHIHKLRVSTRRYTAAVEFGAQKIKKKQQNHLDDLEQLRRKAGKVRDLDIDLALLNDMNGDAQSSAELSALAEFVARKRQRRVQKLSAEGVRLRSNRLLDHMESIGEKSLSSGQFDGSSALVEAQSRLAKLAHKSRQHSNPKPGRLHKLRIQLKMLRYVAELASESPAQTQLLESLKGIQDALGRWHDWESLARVAEKFFAKNPNSFLPEQLRSLAESHKTEAVRAAAEFFAGFSPSRKLPQRAKAQRPMAVNA